LDQEKIITIRRKRERLDEEKEEFKFAPPFFFSLFTFEPNGRNVELKCHQSQVFSQHQNHFIQNFFFAKNQ